MLFVLVWKHFEFTLQVLHVCDSGLKKNVGDVKQTWTKLKKLHQTKSDHVDASTLWVSPCPPWFRSVKKLSCWSEQIKSPLFINSEQLVQDMKMWISLLKILVVWFEIIHILQLFVRLMVICSNHQVLIYTHAMR